jgi:hypothetical protein
MLCCENRNITHKNRYFKISSNYFTSSLLHEVMSSENITSPFDQQNANWVKNTAIKILPRHVSAILCHTHGGHKTS